MRTECRDDLTACTHQPHPRKPTPGLLAFLGILLRPSEMRLWSLPPPACAAINERSRAAMHTLPLAAELCALGSSLRCASQRLQLCPFSPTLPSLLLPRTALPPLPRLDTRSRTP